MVSDENPEKQRIKKIGVDISPEEVVERLEEQGGDFVLLAVSPEILKGLGEEFDPSNSTVSAKTLGRLIKE
ncbi:MAG: hypothetical protein KAI72_00605 [Candidatus Pacebacteria bacterium]|nr:hypothetical protein [Candidatus Paceibacterota bacterium]